MKKTFLFLFLLILLVPSNSFGYGEFTFSTIEFDDFFGHDVELIGDLDGDGVTDIAVGSPYDNDGGNSNGAVYILFLNPDGTVKSHQKISSIEGNFRENLESTDSFGFSSSKLNDLDGDGITDIAVGSPYRNYYDNELSPLHILFLNSDGTVKSFKTIPEQTIIQGNYDFVYYIGILLFFVILSVLIVWKKFGKNKKQKISN